MELTIGVVTLLSLAQTIAVGGLIVRPSFGLAHILLILLGTSLPVFMVSLKEIKCILELSDFRLLYSGN